MDLFTYLMAKNGHNTSIHEDLFSYLLGKAQGGGGEIKTATGITINIPDAKKLVSFMMTKESTQDGEPSPYYPQEVKTVKGYRNLFDNDGTLSTGKRISTSTGGLYNATDYTTTTYIDIIENNNYSLTTGISSYYCWYDENKDKISAGTWSTSGGYKRAPENSKYIRFDFLTENINNIQFTESIQELPYVPYGNNYVNVAVSDGTNTNNYPIPLNNNEIVGIGDYKDELKVDKSGNVFINKKTGKVVLDGSEDWKVSNNGNFYNWPSNIFPTTGSPYITPSAFSNYYIATTYNNINNAVVDYGFGFGSTAHRIDIRNKDITTLKDWKTWLSTHNTEVYYVLETPETIDLQTTVDLKLFKGVNNVSNSEDGYMTIEYVSENEEA